MLSDIEKTLAARAPDGHSLVSVGVFDGVHLGHQSLLKRLADDARSRSLRSVVVTFRQHPVTILTPGAVVPMLTSVEERERLVRQLGVDIVVVLDFTPVLAETGARPFVLMLQKHLHMQGMLLGWDFALGRGRKGSLDALCGLGDELGFTTGIVGPVRYHDVAISSTAIRRALSDGDIAGAVAMLGHSFTLCGEVVAGDRRGTTLGFPTANLSLALEQALPADGVYAALARPDGQDFPAVAFIGTKETFGGRERVVEVHIIGFSGDTYRRKLEVDIIERLRGVVRFPDAAALITQIREDVARAADILRGRVK